MNTGILKKYKFKLFIKKNSKYLIGISLLLVGWLVGIYFSYSKFSVKQETEVVRTVVGDFISGDVVLAYSIDGVKGSDAFPKQNTGYEGVSVTCDNEATASWDNTIWSIKMTNSGNGKRVKCNVDFKSQETKNISGINFKLNTFSPDFSKSACSTCESTESGVFATEDDYGTSYYYRGSVENNYVDFAGKIWRIIRINGDGSVRIILNDVLETTSSFNSAHTDNAYVGYMYGTPSSSSYEETHKNINDSTIKKYLDTWYKNNLKNTKYEQYIVNNIFCSERTFGEYHTDSNFVNLGYGKTLTQYRGSYGPWSASSDSNNAKMTYKCQNNNDVLKLPIGLITKDEGVLAGGYNVRNDNLFISDGNENWTISPDCYNDMDNYEEKGASNRCFFGSGYFSCDSNVTVELGVKPVINLKAGSLKSGLGTMESPYTVE